MTHPQQICLQPDNQRGNEDEVIHARRTDTISSGVLSGVKCPRDYTWTRTWLELRGLSGVEGFNHDISIIMSCFHCLKKIPECTLLSFDIHKLFVCFKHQKLSQYRIICHLSHWTRTGRFVTHIGPIMLKSLSSDWLTRSKASHRWEIGSPSAPRASQSS